MSQPMSSSRLRGATPPRRQAGTLSRPAARRLAPAVRTGAPAGRMLAPTTGGVPRLVLPPVAPDPPSITKAREAAVAAAAKAAEPEGESRPWYAWQNVARNMLNTLRYPFSIGVASPVIAAKTAQTAYGIAETFMGDGVKVVDGKPTFVGSRYEQDMAKAKAEGLGRLDRVVAATKRSMPLISEGIESMRTTPPFLAETFTGGLVDTGQPGFDLYQAYTRGQLPSLLFEQGGNVILAGRLLGLGNVGVRAGARVGRNAPPTSPRARLGQTIQTVGRFTEEPIGTSTRGLARGISSIGREYAERTGKVLSPRMSRALDTFQMMSESRSPLMTGASRMAESFRLSADARVATLDSELGVLADQRKTADTTGDTEAVTRIDEEIKKKENQRKRLVGMGETAVQARRAQAETTRQEAARAGLLRSIVISFDELGAAPEAPEVMRARATQLRTLADQREALAASAPTEEATKLRADAQSARDFADFNDRMASVKEANPEKLQDTENRAVNFEAAIIVNSKLIDQVMADLDAGLSFDEIMSRIQPKELIGRTIEAGYGYTPEGVQRAIDFARGAVDEVDRLEMDVSSRILNMFADEMQRYATEPGTLVGGVLSPAQFGDIPMPEILIKELDKRKFGKQVYNLLDQELALIIREGFDDLAETLGDKLDKPEGLFKKFASARPDSREYQASYLAVSRFVERVSDPRTSVFRRDPRLALEVAQFFNDPAIFGARMRPMLAYRESARQALRAEDVQGVLYGLRQFVNEFPEMMTASRRASLQTLLDTLAKSDTAVYDRRFYMRVQDLLNGVLKDIGRRRQSTGARLGEAGRRMSEAESRLAEVEAQARSAAAMIEEALLEPERFTPDITAETQALETQAAGLESEARLLASATVDVSDINSRLEAESATLTKAQSERDAAQQTLDDAQRTLDAETRIWDAARRDAQQPETFLAEVIAAEELAQRGVNSDPPMEAQRSWKKAQVEARRADVENADRVVNQMFSGFEKRVMQREDFWATDIWVRLKRAIPNEKHLREFFQRLTETKYEGVQGRVPVRAEMQVLDPNIGKPLRAGLAKLDELANDHPLGPRTSDEWVDEFGQAWTNYMNAVDELKAMEKKPFKSEKAETVKDAMTSDQYRDLEQEGWMNPATGQVEYGVRPLAELRQIEQLISDAEMLARQADVVENLRKDRDSAARAVENANRRVQSVERRIDELSSEAAARQAESGPARAKSLLGEARLLRSEATRLQQENVKAGRLAATERITVRPEGGAPLRVGRLTRAEGEVTGYQFTSGVAKKLTAEQNAQLRAQQKAYGQTRELQAKFNAEDEALVAGREVVGGAQQYPQSFTQPAGRALLQGAQRPRLMGETDQPTWMPVGEAAGVFESARAPKKITTEGMAAEGRLSIENQRQSTFMPLTPGQFARRMTEILSQTGRNRVVNSILTNQQFASNVETLLTPEKFAEMRSAAEASVRATGIPLNSADFEKNVRLQLGNDVMIELSRRGFEPVSSVKMPDPTDPYAGRESVGDLLGKIDPQDIEPTTIVMKKGLRENIAAQYRLASTDDAASLPGWLIKEVQNKTAGWKSVVLPFSVRWQVGDTAGNIINAAVRAGLSPQDTVRLMVDIYRRTNPGARLTIPQMAQPIFSSSIVDPVISVLVGAGLQTANIKLSELNRMHPKGSLRPSVGAGRFGRRFFPKLREASFNVNETQNALARSAVAEAQLIDELAKSGRTPEEIDPVALHNNPELYGAVVNAVKSANDALGNFSQLSFNEKQYIRAVYPFWSWIKFINTAAAQLLLTQPDRVLFYTHLGSLAMGDDAEEFYGWMRSQVPVPTPWGTFMMDLSFLNPYADALLLQTDPFASSLETATGISPVLSLPLGAIAESYYAATGSAPPLLRVSSRPGYLEGRPDQTTRTLGDTLGGLGYQTFRAFAGPFRLATEIAPTMYVPGTDVLLGPGPRYPQGSPRTTGIYARPRLSPTQQRISAALRSFGIPAPTADIEQARLQAAEQRRAGARALRRRERERRLSRIGR